MDQAQKGDRVGPFRFATKKQLVERARRILQHNPPGSVLRGDEDSFMRALLARHPRAREKIGSGISAICIDVNPVWNGQSMFIVRRSDGTQTDFSYRKCIHSITPMNRFSAACRTAVVNDILEFKRRHFDCEGDEADQVVCPLTGRRLGWHDVHVDHGPPWPFRRIVRAFIDHYGIEVSQVAVAGSGDGETVGRFADENVTERFRMLHAEVARLRIIETSENLRSTR